MTLSEKLKAAKLARKIDVVWFKMTEQEKKDFKEWWQKMAANNPVFRALWMHQTTIASTAWLKERGTSV